MPLSELRLALQQLGSTVNNVMSPQQYVDVDNGIETSDALTHSDIVALASTTTSESLSDSDADNDEPPPAKPSCKEARSSINAAIQFVECNEELCTKYVTTLNQLMEDLYIYSVTHTVQSDLLKFVNVDKC